jgi:hypothetical protein
MRFSLCRVKHTIFCMQNKAETREINPTPPLADPEIAHAALIFSLP